MTREFLEKAAEKVGWEVAITTPHNSSNNYYVCFSTNTTRGKDVEYDFEIDDFDELPDLLYDEWQNYDINKETSIWIGNDGHGKNGAPSDIEDILDEMKQVESPLEKLYMAVKENLQKIIVDFLRQAKNLLNDCLVALTFNSHKEG